MTTDTAVPITRTLDLPAVDLVFDVRGPLPTAAGVVTVGLAAGTAVLQFGQNLAPASMALPQLAQ